MICRAFEHRIVIAYALSCVVMSGCSRGQKDSAESADTAQQPRVPVTQAAWPPDDRRNDTYVGSARCATCHQEIYDSYVSQHPMGRSINQLDLAGGELAIPTEASFQAGGYRYDVAVNSNGKLQHTESLTDGEGTIFSQTEAMDFAIGSGARGYSFVFSRNGCLYQSPLTWYTQGARWDLSPGYQSSGHPRFGRRITEECIYCHSGVPNRHPTDLDRLSSPLFVEPSISCERCHGPGENHCSIHLHPSAEQSPDDIVNPAQLTPVRRDSVCYQCHLHGKDRVLREGRSSFDFRPGDLVSDVWAVLVEDQTDAQGPSQVEAVSQSEQMVSSACYKQSSGRLGCISCHSPHGLPDQANRIQFYRDRCTACHGAEDSDCSLSLHERLKKSAEDSCIECHMPRAAAFDVPHTAQTDHRVLRSYSGRGEATSSSLVPFERGDFPLPGFAVQRALGLRLEKTAATKTDANRALRLLSDAIINQIDVPAMIAASWISLRLGDANRSVQLARAATALQPGHESALEALAIAQESLGTEDEALENLKKIVERAPWSAVIQNQRARILMATGDSRQAIEALEVSLSVDPTQVQVRRQLVRLLKADERDSEAQKHESVVRRLEARTRLIRGQQP